MVSVVPENIQIQLKIGQHQSKMVEIDQKSPLNS